MLWKPAQGALAFGLVLAGCQDVGVDAFPASVTGECPPGFGRQNGRCYRVVPAVADAGIDGRGAVVAIDAAANRPLEPADGPSARDLAGGDLPASPPVAPDGPTNLCAGITCQYQNASSACDPRTGSCSRPVCLEGYGDCDQAPGCESRLDTAMRCGTCNTACQPGQTCVAPGSCRCALDTCGSECVDLRTSELHCGRCDRRCPAGCAGGTCVCPIPSGSNLIDNGGLDRNTSGWPSYDEGPGLTWRPEDAAGCGGSGSMIVHNLHPEPNVVQESGICIRVTPGTGYDFGMWMKELSVPTPTFRVGVVVLDWFTSNDCSGSFFDQAQAMGLPDQKEWTPFVGTGKAPPSARSGRLKIVITGGGNQIQVDMLFVSLSPARFYQ